MPVPDYTCFADLDHDGYVGARDATRPALVAVACYDRMLAAIAGSSSMSTMKTSSPISITARRIIAHCNLPWDDRCLAFHETDRPVRTASAMQVRQLIYNSTVGRWRVYEEFLEPLLTALGKS